MFDALMGLAAEAGEITSYDWTNLDLSGITTTANTIGGKAIPIIVTVALIPIGVKLLKRFISKV